MIGLVVGGFIGWLRPDWGNAVYFLRDIFLNLIKSIIAPLVFSTIVVGIAGAGDLRKVGRMGLKAIVYFEIATTAALFIGLAVVNFTKPGVGVTLVAGPNEVVNTIAHTHPKTLLETVVHAFPVERDRGDGARRRASDRRLRGSILDGRFRRRRKRKADRARDGEPFAGDVQIHQLRHDVRADRRRRSDGAYRRDAGSRSAG